MTMNGAIITKLIKKSVSLQNYSIKIPQVNMHIKGKLCCLIAVFGLLIANIASQAQNINSQDLSQLRVDDLSDAQIRSFMQQAESSGLSESQMMQMAGARGMSSTEMDKLRQRVNQLQSQGSNQRANQGLFGTDAGQQQVGGRRVLGMEDSTYLQQDSVDGMQKTPEQLAEEALRARIYGADLFINSNPRFEPNLRVATPSDYVVGSQDKLNIDIYGNSEASYQLEVNPDGNINIPYVGVVNVGGATIEQATARIRNRMASIYTAMRSGATRLTVTLGDIRSIKVIITGEVVKPGTYTLPSVATIFNALYSSGGPTSRGSLRSIKVLRENKVIADLDLYEFLQNGSMSGNISLRDQDVIQVNPYLSRVEMIGEVKRPKLFEIKEGETFDDLLAYAGGFTEDAYQERISAFRNTGREHRLEDVLRSQFNQFEPRTGDKFTIERLLNRFANRVIIDGSVFRPGQYELSSGLTLSMLIKKADGVKEEAFLRRGYIIRLKDDFQREQLSFNVADVLAGTATDIPLKREDMVFISSIFDLRNEYVVEVNGEVRKPGKYDFAEGMTLEQLIVQAGGFTESGTATRVEVARRVSNSDVLMQSSRTAEIFHVDVDRDLGGASDFALQPFDLISIRVEPGYERQRTVKIEGEILYPGEYTLSRKDERLSDLLRRAGGFTAFAYVDGASLKRKDFDDTHVDSTSNIDQEALEQQEALQQERLLRLTTLQQGELNPNTNNLQQQAVKNDNYVGINMVSAIKSPGSLSDLILEEGDVIRIPKQLQTVRVSGEVLAPVTVVYNTNKGFKQYISQAGGFSQRALRKRAYVVYANGSAKSTGRFLFFNNYPRIKPGAEIFVPQRLERERMNAAQWVGLGSGVASSLAVIFAIFR